MRTLLATATAGLLVACSFNPEGHDNASYDLLDLSYFSLNSEATTIGRADAGDADAQLAAGDFYYWGEGVERNGDTALHYWSLAADQGNEAAAERLHTVLSGQPLHYNPDGSPGRDLVTSVWKDTFDRI